MAATNRLNGAARVVAETGAADAHAAAPEAKRTARVRGRALAAESLVPGDLVRDWLDGGKYRRFVRSAGEGFVELADRDTLVPLPDYRHVTQVERA